MHKYQEMLAFFQTCWFVDGGLVFMVVVSWFVDGLVLMVVLSIVCLCVGGVGEIFFLYTFTMQFSIVSVFNVGWTTRNHTT